MKECILWVICLALSVVCACGDSTEGHPLVVLTQDNYTSFLKNNELVLVEFTAPWCGHCRKMGKEYDKAAEKLEHLESPGRLAIIDASLKENYGVVDDAKVEGFPAFLLYRNGRHVLNYTGLRTESHFVDYMLEKNSPLITKVDTLEDLLKYFRGHFDPLKESSDDATIPHYFYIGMISSSANEDKRNVYYDLMEDISSRNDKSSIHFVYTETESILDYFFVPEESYESFSVSSVMISSSSTIDNHLSSILRTDISSSSTFEKFIMTSSSEAVVAFGQENLHLLRSSFAPKNQVLVFCDESEVEGDACLKAVKNVAPAYRGTFLFVTISHNELHMYHTFGINIGSSHPQIMVLNITDEHQPEKYLLNHDVYALIARRTGDEAWDDKNGKLPVLTDETLHVFLKMYLKTEIPTYYRSEENSPANVEGADAADESSADAIPDGETDEEKQQREGLLPVHVTSLSLKEKVVLNPETVLLFITAPWCGHCKSLEPVIHALAKLLHQRKRKYEQIPAIPSLAGLPTSDDVVTSKVDEGAVDDVIVARIDGSVNDVHSLGSIDVNGFPTIVFVRYVDGKKEAIEYTGERTVKDILQFIHKNGVSLTMPSADASMSEEAGDEL